MEVSWCYCGKLLTVHLSELIDKNRMSIFSVNRRHWPWHTSTYEFLSCWESSSMHLHDTLESMAIIHSMPGNFSSIWKHRLSICLACMCCSRVSHSFTYCCWAKLASGWLQVCDKICSSKSSYRIWPFSMQIVRANWLIDSPPMYKILNRVSNNVCHRVSEALLNWSVSLDFIEISTLFSTISSDCIYFQWILFRRRWNITIFDITKNGHDCYDICSICRVNHVITWWFITIVE